MGKGEEGEGLLYQTTELACICGRPASPCVWIIGISVATPPPKNESVHAEVSTRRRQNVYCKGVSHGSYVFTRALMGGTFTCPFRTMEND